MQKKTLDIIERIRQLSWSKQRPIVTFRGYERLGGLLY
jgi:hypothetical protein